MNRISRLIAVLTIAAFAQGCELAGAILVIDAAHALSHITANSSKKTSSESVENSASLAALTESSNATEKSIANVNDVSGTYISEITVSGNAAWTKRFLKKEDRKEITLKQTGNTITGTDSSKKIEISGTREGGQINFYIIRGNQIDGVWKINADATKLEGKWHTDGHGGASGEWNLTKVD